MIWINKSIGKYIACMHERNKRCILYFSAAGGCTRDFDQCDQIKDDFSPHFTAACRRPMHHFKPCMHFETSPPSDWPDPPQQTHGRSEWRRRRACPRCTDTAVPPAKKQWAGYTHHWRPVSGKEKGFYFIFYHFNPSHEPSMCDCHAQTF